MIPSLFFFFFCQFTKLNSIVLNFQHLDKMEGNMTQGKKTQKRQEVQGRDRKRHGYGSGSGKEADFNYLKKGKSTVFGGLLAKGVKQEEGDKK